MIAPVFCSDGSRLGLVRVVFDPAMSLNVNIAPLIKGTDYAVTASQLDSKILFDTDPGQQGKVLFDPIYASNETKKPIFCLILVFILAGGASISVAQ